jgi:predicted nucleic acid-binding protein
MSKKGSRLRTTLNLKKPLYLNANLIYSELVGRLKDKKGSTLTKLKGEGYTLVSSSLVKMEVVQNLRKLQGVRVDVARNMYDCLLEELDIVELLVHNHFRFTENFLDTIAKTGLSLKDAIHLCIAKDANMPVCSHDTKIKKESSFGSKESFYDNVHKPEELIKPQKKD